VIKGRELTRRAAIRYGLGAAAGVLAPELLELGPDRAVAVRGARSATIRHELRNPRALRSRHGLLHLRLRCTPATVDVNAGRLVRTYTYDGVVPGYTWELQGGDTLVVDLVNHLPPLHSDAPMIMDRPHEWTTTNLHTHGLHVSPSGIADNIFLDVPPGERQRYVIPVPHNHPAGLFWYHPHRHGAVTQQLRGGMAGLIIVRGDLDEVPEVAAARERVMVLQSIELGTEYELLDPIPNPTRSQAFFPRQNVLYTINGKLNPVLTMYPGEVQRWRLVNAAEGKFMSLALEHHELQVLAWDGLTMRAPEGVELVMMSAGNRVELLVRAGARGRYELMLTPGSSQKPNIPGMPPSAMAGNAVPLECDLMAAGPMPGLADQPPELAPRSIATIEVRGRGPRMGLPDALPAWDPPMLPIARQRRVRYTVSRDAMNEFLSFGIDGKAFDPTAAPYQAKLNTAEEWTVVNDCDNKLMDHAHVFHIHVNPFKVTAMNGRRLATPLWRDTFVITKRSGDSFTFETNFARFTGKFVQHCHVLAHEDLGMMESIEVIR